MTQGSSAALADRERARAFTRSGARRLPPPVAACLAALGFPQEAWSGRIALRMHSGIHRAIHAGVDVVIKECFDPISRAPDPAAARHEFDALSRVGASAVGVGMRLVPEALALCEAEGAYAMRYVGGPTMSSLVLSTRTDAASLGAQAGVWLRSFHGAHLLGTRRNDFESKLPFVAHMQAADGAREPLIERASRALENTAARAADVAMPASWIHGDMKSDNLIVEGQHVVGLDVHAVDENTVVYDLAPFVNHLMLLRRSPGGCLRREALRAMSDAFLAAYSPYAIGWRLPVLWLRAYLLMQPLVAATRSLSGRIAAAPRRRELAAVLDALETK